MTASMDDATLFIDTLHIDAQQFFKHIQLLVESQLFATEYPGTSEGGTSNHHRIDTILLEMGIGIDQRGDIAIANDRDVNPWVLFHLSYQGPVCLSRVHLCPSASVYGKCLYATVLQLFCQLGDDQLFAVPSQPCLHGNGNVYGFYNLPGDVEHLGNILQHAGSSPLTSHLLDRTSKVDVNQVGTSLLHNTSSLDHRLGIATIYLYAYRTLLVADGELADGGFHIADQSLGTDKLGVHHSSTKALAQQTETDVGDVFHRSEEDGMSAQCYIADYHLFVLLRIVIELGEIVVAEVFPVIVGCDVGLQGQRGLILVEEHLEHNVFVSGMSPVEDEL